ncbi:MAG TPA: NAD(P)H-hydrate dehydratase [Bacteroidia bacterium]|nr:NAD(P)H-hydrate dehydratase [Bacteroidia bacterium]
MKTLTKQNIKLLLKPREVNSHKGNHGHALIVAGSKGKMGAAVIAAKACLRAGVGLLTVNVPKNERAILQTSIPEAMLEMREDAKQNATNFSVIGVGSGIGVGKHSEDLLVNIITKIDKPLVLDADALNIIASNKKLLSKIPKGTILTPHPKEFDRLFGNHKNDEERINVAIKKAKQHNIIIVLKGHKTLITYAGETFLNTSGNAGLAKGGSGDALTGIITAFLAQGYEPKVAAKLGVYLHGLAADIALQNQSMESMLITDVIEYMGKAFKNVMK